MNLGLDMLAEVIITTFDLQVGKHQATKPVPTAMQVSFRMYVEHEKEEGYRYLDLLIYGPANYVGIYERTRWDVIPQEDLTYDEESDEYLIKEGKSYNKGTSPWALKGYHDSGWRDAIRRVLREHAPKMMGLDKRKDWYGTIDAHKLDLPSS